MLLAEDEAFMDEARRWRRRCGGDLIHHYPAILAAQIGIETHLARMPDYVAQAQCIARLTNSTAVSELVPRQPLTNLFHIIIRYPKEAVLDILYNDVLRRGWRSCLYHETPNRNFVALKSLSATVNRNFRSRAGSRPSSDWRGYSGVAE